jgi:hypothetical protein
MTAALLQLPRKIKARHPHPLGKIECTRLLPVHSWIQAEGLTLGFVRIVMHEKQAFGNLLKIAVNSPPVAAKSPTHSLSRDWESELGFSQVKALFPRMVGHVLDRTSGQPCKTSLKA